MRITKVTTRNGDGGKTNLAKGESVLKSDNIIHCLGEVDELSSIIGVCLSFSQNSDITEFLKKIQNNLFDIGGHISMNLEVQTIDFLSESGFDPVYGARPLKRAIQKELETALARAVLSGEIKDGQHVNASVVNGKISFDLKSLATSTD